MTISNTAAWDALPMDTRVMFYDIASKEGSTMTGAEWFYHLVPEQLQDNHEHVEVFMNGGTVTQEAWVHDQGMANGHYEQVEYEISDKDVSRIQSGENGGDYTADNTVMEDASANRSRQADDMTSDELETINETNAFEAEVIDGSEVLYESTDAATSTLEAAEVGTDLLGVVGDILTDVAAPAIGATMAAQAVSNHFETTEDKLGYGALAAGGAALVCMTPPGQIFLTTIAVAKLAVRVGNWMDNPNSWWNEKA